MDHLARLSMHPDGHPLVRVDSPVALARKGGTDDPPGETYWKVANGIRLTGMPAFNKSLTEEQMWQVSLMVANTDKLSPSVAASLREPLPQ